MKNQGGKISLLLLCIALNNYSKRYIIMNEQLMYSYYAISII